MKILYDHTVFQFQRYGGISRYFYELITRLSTKEDVGIKLFQGYQSTSKILNRIGDINGSTKNPLQNMLRLYWQYLTKFYLITTCLRRMLTYTIQHIT
jgi:hypothetical protein